MEVLRPFPISLILLSVFIFLCTVGQLYSAIAVPSASFSYANYATDLSASDLYANYATDLSVSASGTSYGNDDSYIVSVNHHLPDVGKRFASHLSSSLISHGLRIGNIETASVHIAIFSKNYAKSSCCLDHLLIMLKSGATIIPVFYDVKPSDLRCCVIYAPVLGIFRWTRVKSGALYCEDLRMLEEEKKIDTQTCQKRRQNDSYTIIFQERPQYDSNTITEWRKALFYASEISGFELREYKG